jgi:general secretion pathway protein E
MDPPGAVPSPDRVPADFLAAIPHAFAREHHLLAQGDGADGVLLVAPGTSAEAVWNAATRLGRTLATAEAEPEALVRAIDGAYERAAAGGAGAIAAAHLVAPPSDELDLDRVLAEADRDLLSNEGKAPLVQLVDRLLFHAVQVGASDLHLQPTPDQVLIRHRIDGVLDPGRALPPTLVRPLVSRIKVMGRMDVAERLVPQDGRTSLGIGERSIDVRISTIPTAYGERVVMRLLDASRQLFDAAALGMPPDIETAFHAAAARASGIILVTGPTGSGKTTTLYATLRAQNAIQRNIMTIEDPIEYELSSLGVPISQSQVNPKKGVNFANGLRHILRQDPDVIMVGEIRDAETARIAIQASLTGHLVFSTLHTNDAVSAVTRLIDLGVEPYLVAASLSTVLAQRLVRTRCTACAGSGAVDGAPCAPCHGSGLRGRTGLFEMLVIDEALRSAIAAGSSLADLRTLARGAGMRTLAERGQALVDSGVATPAEIERVIHHG